MTERFLITGGAGFIGSHLAERLLARGDTVCVLDDLSTGSRANLAALDGHPRFEFVLGSVADRSLVESLSANTGMILHLAGAVGVRLVLDRPLASMQTNLLGTEVVLAAAADRQIPILLASTSEVYGRRAPVPYAEDAELSFGATSDLRGGYACAKAMGEWLARGYAAERGLESIVVRFFNTVGPRQTGRYGMVLPRFAAEARAGSSLVVHGDGTQTRAFAHVADVVECLVRLVDSPAARGSVFNVGNDEETSIMALAELTRRLAGSSSRIETVPYAEAFAEGFWDIPRRVPDLRHLESVIGPVPRRSLADIVADVLAQSPQPCCAAASASATMS